MNAIHFSFDCYYNGEVMDRKRATLIGLAAILLWSTMVGLIRSVSEGLGPVGGAALLYTLSGLLCLVTGVFTDIGRFSLR